MPLPIILIAAAAAAAAGGAVTVASSAVKAKDAYDRREEARSRDKRNRERLERQNKITCSDMDNVGKLEFEILKSFKDFSDVYEKIKNRPEFKDCKVNGVNIPKYDAEKIKEVSVAARVLLASISGAALGTIGGFAAAGATTAAVMALGTASTGTAIASLSGAAATNATLAALGGGTIAAGGGGVALGTTVLGAATLGVGLLVGGVIFSIAASSFSDEADEAWKQMLECEKKRNRIIVYLKDLSDTAKNYKKSLDFVNAVYQSHLKQLQNIVYDMKKTEWELFTREEKLCLENTALLVGLLYSMCKVQIVKKSANEKELNEVNTYEINKSMSDAKQVLTHINEGGF